MASQRRPTKRAPDKWESARFRSIFLALSFFYISSRIHAHPLAGNANRWAAGPNANKHSRGSKALLQLLRTSRAADVK